MNANISALMGNVSINSSGNISTNSINNIITAKDIDLVAASSIGDSTRALQVAIYDSTGSLNADAYNVYLNYPNTDVGNITINADNLAYLSTSGSTLGSLDSIVNINADTLELRATNGTIAIDEEDTINVHNIKARTNGDISITLISQDEITEADVNMSEEEYKEYYNNAKDMKIGTIKASRNVSLTSERSILNADDDSSITGEQIVLSTNGDIGSEDSAIKLLANRDITAYAGDGSSVYLTSDGDLHINEIRSYINYDSVTGETSTAGVLENVVLSAKGSITNAFIGVSTTSEDEDGNTVTSTSYDTTNIIAKNITMNAADDIGSLIKYFTINTTDDSAETGLTYSAVNAYIKGTGDTLNVKSASSTEKTYLAETITENIWGKLVTTLSDEDISIHNVAEVINYGDDKE